MDTAIIAAPAHAAPSMTSPLSPDAGRLSLVGVLRQRPDGLVLEQRLAAAPGARGDWLTARIYRLLPTPATADAARALTGQPVAISGTPCYVAADGSSPGRLAARRHTYVVLDSVLPASSLAGAGAEQLPA